MKKVSQTLALIISIQLAVGCNGTPAGSSPVIKTPPPASGDTVQISGSIARAINSFSGLIVPAAQAAEGDLHIYDVTNPLEPIKLHSEAITGKNTFKVKMKKSEIGSKLIKAVFVSTESTELSRELLFDLEGTESIVDASMDENTSIRSKIFEAQLIAEGVSDPKARFREIRSDSLSSEFELLGDSALFYKLMLDPSISKSIADLVAKRRIAINEGDSATGIELQSQIFAKALENGVVTDESVLRCDSTSGAFFFKDQKFKVFAKPIESDAIRKLTGVIDLGVVSTTQEASERISKLVSLLKDLTRDLERGMSARIYFEALESEPKAVKSCRLYGWEVSEAELVEVNNLSDKDYVNSDLLNSVSFDEFAGPDEALKRLFDYYMKTMLEFQEKAKSLELDPLIISEATKRTNTLFEKRFIEFYKYFYPSKSMYLYEIDTSFFQAVDLDLVANPEMAYDLLLEAHDKSLSSLKDMLLSQEMSPEELELIMSEQRELCKYLLELRVMELKWHFSNN